LGIVITAAYVLRVTTQVFLGEFNAQLYPEVGDIAITDRVILLLLGLPLIIVGILPGVIAPMIQAGVTPVVALLGGA
jgi:NADH:ubiquinone oxidoreductase subunit 4 (subunit M)